MDCFKFQSFILCIITIVAGMLYGCSDQTSVTKAEKGYETFYQAARQATTVDDIKPYLIQQVFPNISIALQERMIMSLKPKEGWTYKVLNSAESDTDAVLVLQHSLEDGSNTYKQSVHMVNQGDRWKLNNIHQPANTVMELLKPEMQDISLFRASGFIQHANQKLVIQNAIVFHDTVNKDLSIVLYTTPLTLEELKRHLLSPSTPENMISATVNLHNEGIEFVGSKPISNICFNFYGISEKKGASEFICTSKDVAPTVLEIPEVDGGVFKLVLEGSFIDTNWQISVDSRLLYVQNYE